MSIQFFLTRRCIGQSVDFFQSVNRSIGQALVIFLVIIKSKKEGKIKITKQKNKKSKTMKVYRIKTNDFSKITSNKNLLTDTQKELLSKYESLTGCKAKKFLPRGKDIVLLIGQDNKYYITSKPVYVDSIAKILESVGIDQDSIIVMNRNTGGQSQELTLDQVKNFLTVD